MSRTQNALLLGTAEGIVLGLAPWWALVSFTILWLILFICFIVKKTIWISYHSIRLLILGILYLFAKIRAFDHNYGSRNNRLKDTI